MILGVVPQISPPSVDWFALGPEIAVAGAGILIVLVRALLRRRAAATPLSFVIAFSGIAAAGAILWRQWQDVHHGGAITTVAGMLRVDGFAIFLGTVVLASTVLALLLAAAYLRREGLEQPEYIALMMLSASGMLAMTTANDLVVVFLALEILSIPLYVLAAFDRRRLTSQESGIKYFLLGAFSSAIFLYGVALTYGATGTTSLTGIGTYLANNTLLEQGTLVAGFALLLVGLGFKVAAVPFHMWTPDVYQGAPTPVTAFMSSATKAAGFAALIRVFTLAFPTYREDWRPAIWALAALTLAVGSIAAVIQTDVKRVLAYSSISHAGFILVAFQVATPRGREAALLYLFAYAFMVIGSFAVITIATRRGDDHHSFDDYRGLALRRPVLGGLLAFFLLAQAGVPVTSGFIVKLQVFAAGVDRGEYVLTVIALLASVVAAFFYLRIAVALFSAPAADESPEEVAAQSRPVDVWSGIVLFVCAGMTLVIGILPGTFMTFAKGATFLL